MSGAQLDLSTRTIKIFKSAFDATARANITAHVADNDNPHAVTKAQVGLALVDDTADADKPISSAAAAALAAKAPLASPALTGTPTAPTAATGDVSTQIATTANAQAKVNVVAGDLATTAAALAAHAADTADPHNVTAAQVGLGNVDNTSDVNKPVSSATQTALNLKAPLASPALTGVPTAPTAAPGTNTTQLASTAFAKAEADAVAVDLATHEADAANPHGVTATQVGLGAVDNTSDANKPISTATATALALKAPLASPALTGEPTVPTAAPGTNTTQAASTAFTAAAVAIAQAVADQALLDAFPVASLFNQLPERPGDGIRLYGETLTGAPSAATMIDPTWFAVSDSGLVIRVDAADASDPQVVTPAAAFAIEPGRFYDVRYKVQRQTDPGDPLNDSVTLAIRWLDENKAGMPGGGGTALVEDIPLEVVDGVQERIVRIALESAPDGYAVDHAAPAGTVYFRPYVEMFGDSHVTDVVVISVVPQPLRQDIYNIKNYLATGGGADEADAISEFFSALASTYPHGISPTISPLARGGFIGGGKFRADGLTVGSAGFGWSLRGDGAISQLSNIGLSIDHNNASISDLRIIGEDPLGATGTGVNMRSQHSVFTNVDVMNKAIGYNLTDSATDGGFSNANRIFGGWIRDNTIGIRAAQNDIRGFGLRVTGGTTALEFSDGGGIQFVGCNFGSLGPSGLFRGDGIEVTGTTAVGDFVITNVLPNTDEIDVDDILSGREPNGELLFPSNTRVVSKTSNTITVDRAPLYDLTAAEIFVREIPVESFWLGNTFGNSGGTFKYTYDILSIVSANDGDSILITLEQEHTLSVGMGLTEMNGTGVDSYDTERSWIVSIPSSRSIVLNIPWVQDLGNIGQVSATAYSFKVQSGGSNAAVRGQWFIGGNHNGSFFEGGANIAFIGTRLKTQNYMMGSRPFLADTVATSITVINTSIPTSELREGQTINAGAGGIVGGVIGTITGPHSFELVEPATTTAVQASFQSLQQPNNIFHIAVPDDQWAGGTTIGGASSAQRNQDTMFTGPGSLLGWSQFGMLRLPVGSYAAAEGSSYLGGRVPYTRGGLLDNQAADLNLYGIMNNGWRVVSNGTQHDLQGGQWIIRDPRTWTVTAIETANSGNSILVTVDRAIPLRAQVGYLRLSGTGNVAYDNIDTYVEDATGLAYNQVQLAIDYAGDEAAGGLRISSSNLLLVAGAVTPQGTTLSHSGDHMNVELQAFRSPSGAVYGSSIFRLRAPLSTTPANETGPGGGFIVNPGNDSDTTTRLIIGAANADVDLTGNAAALEALANTAIIKLDSVGRTEWFFGSATPWASISRTSNSLITWSQNAASRFIYSNENTGAAAEADIEVRQTANSSTTAVRMAVYSTGFTPSGIAVADGGAVYSDTLLSGGLGIGAMAANADVRLFAGGTLAMTIGGVSQRITTAGLLQIPAGATGAGNLAVAFTGDTDTGFRQGGADSIVFETGGSPRLTIAAGGIAVTNAMRVVAGAFAGLPTPVTGMVACINNSTVNTIGATIAGGGGFTVLGWWNGTNWTVIGQ